MKLKILKKDNFYKMPIRAYDTDAGMDCFATEDFTIPSIFNIDKLNFKGEYVVMTGLGFGINIPQGYQVEVRPKSSFNAKGIHTYLGTVDSGYTGEIKVAFTSFGLTQKIKKGDKICQLVLMPVVDMELVGELKNNRGEGGFGSTGK